MLHKTNPFLYKLSFLAVGTLVIASIFFLTIFVSAATASSQQPENTNVPSAVYQDDDNPNVVAGAFGGIASAFGQRMSTAGDEVGSSLGYEALAFAQSGRFFAHSTFAVAQGASHGVLFTARTVVNGNMLMLSVPAKITAPIAHLPTVSSIIRPVDSTPIPVISAETSAEVLAHYNAQQQVEIAKLQAAQLVANQGLDGVIVAGDPNHGGYPAKWDNRSQDSTLDSWGMYNRECVSYAAWKVYQTYGDMPYWGGVGNANQWVGDARHAGIATGSAPQVHSVAISMSGYYGHAMWVEGVSPDGRSIYVSQYNYDLHGHYSEMWVNGSHFTYIYFK